MLIKICGITKIDEVIEINKLKPDYIGFVFTESKRKISKDTAYELFKVLDKDIKVVGVFRNNSINEIKEILKYIPLNTVQLHGREDNNFIHKLHEISETEIWKAIAITSEEDMISALNYNVNTLVLDGTNPGSGKIFPWKVTNELKTDKKIILAGGITEDNVLDGIRLVKPQGVDISSGVESIDKKGRRIKDREKMRRFIKKVRESNEGKI